MDTSGAFRSVRVTTQVLYGIFASHKSHAKGLRNLVKAEHAMMLADKVTRHRLPAELTDIVAGHLAQLEREDVKRVWQSRWDNVEDLFRHFQLSGRTTAERTVLDKLKSLGVLAVRIQSTVPSYDESHLRNGSVECYYVHLSASGSHPSMHNILSIPSCLVADNTIPQAGIPYFHPRVTTVTTITQQSSVLSGAVVGKHEICSDSVLSISNGLAKEPNDKHARMASKIERVIQVQDQEEISRRWDNEALERYVALLELHLVPAEGDDPLKPVLRIVQDISTT